METLGQLEELGSPAGDAAFQRLTTHVGVGNAGHIGQAVTAHGATPVQEAVAATSAMVEQYRRQGMSDAAILDTFQSGEAVTALRETVATPLSDDQLAAVADLVLLPQRRLTRSQLAAAIGERVAAGETTVASVQATIGSPVHFGGQTGTVRGVIAGAQALRLAPEEMARLAEQIGRGLREAVQAELVGQGHRPEVVSDFLNNLAALPAAITVPQTTAARNRESREENDEETL